MRLRLGAASPLLDFRLVGDAGPRGGAAFEREGHPDQGQSGQVHRHAGGQAVHVDTHAHPGQAVTGP